MGSGPALDVGSCFRKPEHWNGGASTDSRWPVSATVAPPIISGKVSGTKPIGIRANVHGALGVGALLVAALAYSLVTGLCAGSSCECARSCSRRMRTGGPVSSTSTQVPGQ